MRDHMRRIFHMLKGKIQIHFERKYQTLPYENGVIGIIAEFDEDVSLDEAFLKVRERVEGWIETDLVMRGLL